MEVKLSDAVSKLLSEQNKDKSLGELTEELSSYIIEIKELVDSNSISFEALRDEISKHVDLNNKNIPGSVSQLLIGCINENGACPMKREHAEDIAFAYDEKNKTITPLSKSSSPLTEDTYAVLYVNGHPSSISIDCLQDLENKGFKKLRIEYKEISSSNYKSLNIENLKKYLYFKPGTKDNNGLLVICFLFALILLIYVIKK